MSKVLSPFLTDRRESQEDPESHTGRLWVFYSLFYWNRVDLQCCVLSQLFQSPLSPSSRGLFSSSLHPAIRMISSAYLRLLVFLLAILIPPCDSSSPAFHMMQSVYKLNKQGDNIQPWRTPFPIWNQSVVPCPVLTVASWPAYRFHKRQVRWSGIPISWRIFHSLLWSTQPKALA